MMQRRSDTNHSCPLGNCACLSGTVASSLDGIIYVNDPKTYELLWSNDNCMRSFGLEDIGQHKCHELFQGLDEPCPFCPMAKLNFDSFYIWEFYNSKINRHFLIKDKLIRHQGRTLHMEIATDITEKVLEQQVVQQKLEFEQTLLKCVRILLEEDDSNLVIEKTIALAGRQYHADRCYVFESGHDSSNRRVVHNTHEWCAPGIEPQMHTLQNLPIALVSPWMELFLNSREVVIENLEDIRDAHPDLYATLKRQNIQRLFAVPLHLDGILTGFIGVDNPHDCLGDFTLLHSLAYFMDNTISRTRLVDELRSISLHDSLTGLGNRNAYQAACKRLAEEKISNIGVIYIDLNDLKFINDTYGHEKGDEYITSMSAIFSKHFRSSDIFRIGGDEFVAAVYGSADFSSKLAELKQLLEGSYNVDEHSLPISVSIGVISPEAAMLRDKPQHLTLGEFFLEKVDMAIICAPSPAISTSARKLPSMWRKACLPSLPKKAPP